jgi:hypothetical protein
MRTRVILIFLTTRKRSTPVEAAPDTTGNKRGLDLANDEESKDRPRAQDLGAWRRPSKSVSRSMGRPKESDCGCKTMRKSARYDTLPTMPAMHDLRCPHTSTLPPLPHLNTPHCTLPDTSAQHTLNNHEPHPSLSVQLHAAIHHTVLWLR